MKTYLFSHVAHCTSLCLFFLVSRDVQNQYHHPRVGSGVLADDDGDAWSLITLSSSCRQNRGREMSLRERSSACEDGFHTEDHLETF